MSDPRVISEFKRALRDSGAGPKISKALFEAGLVESHLQNLNYGDRDSKGALQQRPSQGWRHARDPYRAALDFIAHAKPIAHQYHRAGDLAQAVQRSAFPGRYQLQSGNADAIRKGLGGSAGAPAGGSTTTRTTPAKTHLGVDQAILDTLSAHVKPGALAKTVLNKLAYDPRYTTTTPAKTVVTHVPGAAPAAHMPPAQEGGTATFDGKKVAPWIAAELRWARAHGWTGTVNSGYRSDAEQKRIYDSGVRPAARPKSEGGGGSNHSGLVFPLGAVDVTNAAQLSALLRRRGSKLQWAGAKDPVHFSHPHGGSY